MNTFAATHALRTLGLPTRVQHESDCIFAFESHLERSGILPDDYLTWVNVRVNQWEQGGKPTKDLISLVETVLCANAANSDQEAAAFANALASKYFVVHSKLMKEHLMPYKDASAFLSYSFVLADLARVHSFSSAQIVGLVQGQPLFASYGRAAIATVLFSLKIARTLSVEQIQRLFNQDAGQEGSALADASFPEASAIVSEKAIALGCQKDLLPALLELAPAVTAKGMTSAYTPYLQMLHYQCSLAEFFDHDPTDIYEYAPRGKKGEWLHNQYPHAIAGAANPFLNNAKSVEILDRSWARSKKSRERVGALALLEVLAAMNAMNFFARKELAFWLRMWLHRIIRVAKHSALALPNTVTARQLERLLEGVSKGNTGSFGVIEQRVVDAVSRFQFPTLRTRGLGDSVNATNISKSKFGDCEFLDAAHFKITAFEAHGGRLSLLYIDAHIASLRKTLPKRIPELTSFADLSAWRLEIVFVAHELADKLGGEHEIDGLSVVIRAVLFKDFLSKAALPLPAKLVPTFNEHVLTHFAEYRTPNEVRTQLLALIG